MSVPNSQDSLGGNDWDSPFSVRYSHVEPKPLYSSSLSSSFSSSSSSSLSSSSSSSSSSSEWSKRQSERADRLADAKSRIENYEQLFEDILKYMKLRVQTTEGPWEDLPANNEAWEDLPANNEAWQELHKYDKDGELDETFDQVTKDELRDVFLTRNKTTGGLIVTSHVTRPHFWECPRAQALLEIAKKKLLLGLTLHHDKQIVSIELPKIIFKNSNYKVERRPNCASLCGDYVYLYSKSSNKLHKSKTKPYLEILDEKGFACEKCLYFVRGINAKQPHSGDKLCTKARGEGLKLKKLAVLTLDADMPDPEILRKYSKNYVKEKKAFTNFWKLLSQERQEEYLDELEEFEEESEEKSEEESKDDESEEEFEEEDSDFERESEKTLRKKRKAYNNAQLKEVGEKGHSLRWRYKVLKSLYEDNEPKYEIEGNEWVYAGKSKMHGVGLFAKKAISSGTLIKVFDDWKKFGAPIKFMRYGKRCVLTKTKRIALDQTDALVKAGIDIQHEINERLKESYETIKRYWDRLQWKDESTKSLCRLPNNEEQFGVHPYVMHPLNETLKGRNDGNVFLQVLKSNKSYWQNVPLFDPVNTCWGFINYSPDSAANVELASEEDVSGSLLKFNKKGGTIKAIKKIAKDEELLWDYGGTGDVKPNFEAIIKEHQQDHLHGGKVLQDPLLVVKMLVGNISELKAEVLKPVATQLLNPNLAEKNAMFQLYNPFDTTFAEDRRLKFDSEVGEKVRDLTPRGLIAFLAEVCLCATYELREKSASTDSSVTDYSLKEARSKKLLQHFKSFGENRNLAVNYCKDVLRRFGVDESVRKKAEIAAGKVADGDEFWLVPTFYAKYDADHCIERVVAKMCFCSAPGAQRDVPDWCVIVFEAKRHKSHNSNSIL